MRVPGASVDGHRGAVDRRGLSAQASCTCGEFSSVQPSVQGACLLLVMHLQAAVRDGARVTYDDDDGLAGVREPRGPVPSRGGGSAELDIA